MRAALIVVCLTMSCSFESGGLGAASALPSDGGGVIGDDAIATTDGGAELGDDAMPSGAITFFRTTACPAGWEPYEPARGRFVLPTMTGEPAGAATGAPLGSGEDRTHTHAFTLTFTLERQSFVAASGGSNGGIAGAAALTIAGATSPSSAGLPYVQLLVCRKVSKPLARPLPVGLQLFFEASACPPGFAQNEESQGRFVIGLPPGAPADQTFGRSPGAEPRTHTHSASATLATSGHGIAAFSGCCADGYAENKSYTAVADTAPAAVELPTIALISCTKT